MARGWRTIAHWALVCLLAVSAALTGASLFGRLPYFELTTHFRVQYLLVAALTTLVFAVRRLWRLLLVGVACLAINLTFIAPYLASPTPSVKAGPAGTRIRLMSANLYLRNRDYEAFAASVRKANPDVLIVQELTPRWWEHVKLLRAEYPYYDALPRPGGSGIAVLSRLPIHEAEVLTWPGFRVDMPGMFVRIETGSGELSLLAMHPPTPMRVDKLAVRNIQFADAAKRMRETDGPRVLIGDLNTTQWSPYFADLVRDSGLRDARIGEGLWPTWPMPLPSLLRIPIDHCLTSDGIRVESIRTGPRTGSDHQPLVVDLTLP